jgi:hypothetical protein
MALQGCGIPLRGSGEDQSVWKLEWTFGAAGAVTLDAAQSDRDSRVATPVADGGTGLVNVSFPKSKRAWPLLADLEPATADVGDGTDYRKVTVTALNAPAGTCVLTLCPIEGADSSPADPETGARGRLYLLLEHS